MLDKKRLKKLIRSNPVLSAVDEDFLEFIRDFKKTHMEELPEYSVMILKMGWEACKLNQKNIK